MRISVALAVLLCACGDNRQGVVIDAAIDAPTTTPDGRPLGVIDGLCTGVPGKPRVLVYSRENLWRHLSNYYSRLAIYNMCQSRGFNVTTTNDPQAINVTRLADFDVVVFAHTSGPGLDPQGRADLNAWVQAGGGVVGLHSASATEPDWSYYADKLIGARFAGHVPGMQPATVKLVGSHPITDGLTDFPATDEWYFFQTRPENDPDLHVVLALDETTLPADYPAMYKQGYHPIGWVNEQYGGRVFYTAIGHNPDLWSDPTILELTGRAIEWCAHQR